MNFTIYEENGPQWDFESLIDDDNIYESRARDLANVIAYDREHYSDVNFQTLVRAAELAGLIQSTGGQNPNDRS